ncbi:hypothetical protein IWQ60_010345 [Tieghemiomyces parasiticus]|uniref:Uncharacterized protein n=1 Tax=Tieghemiomyces parasiticus TaxID=78921 RepID=A0A9W7ZQM1_9FUNG|nr:hypothetical protein IWQ60_010345 [Tieghemiomyces parasiticus]
MKAQSFQLDNSQSLVNKLTNQVSQLENQLHSVQKEKLALQKESHTGHTAKAISHHTMTLVNSQGRLDSIPLSPCSMASTSSRETVSEEVYHPAPSRRRAFSEADHEMIISKVFEMKQMNQELQQEIITVTRRRMDLQNTISAMEEANLTMNERYCEAIDQINELETANRRLRRYVELLKPGEGARAIMATTYDEIILN